MATIFSAADPMDLGHQISAGDVITLNSAGRVLRPPKAVAGEVTGVFVVAGQSNAANNVTGAYTPANAAKIDILNVYDGGCYAAVEPILGCSGAGSNTFVRVADKLIAAGKFARVVLCPVAVNGTTIAEWAPGGRNNARLVVAAKRAAAAGLPMTAFLFALGESDAIAGTTQAAFAAGLAAAIATPRALGFNAPWLIGSCSWQGSASVAAIRAAQASVVNGTTIFAGADSDTLTGTTVNRQADNLHFQAAGADALAVLWRNAIQAAL